MFDLNQRTDHLRIDCLYGRLLRRFISNMCIPVSHTNGRSIITTIGMAINGHNSGNGPLVIPLFWGITNFSAPLGDQ